MVCTIRKAQLFANDAQYFKKCGDEGTAGSIKNKKGDADASDLIKKHSMPREVGTKQLDLEVIQNLSPMVPKWTLRGEKG